MAGRNRSDSEQAYMDATISKAIGRINVASLNKLSGGALVQVTEALREVYEAGVTEAAWKPAPNGVREATGAPSALSGTLRAVGRASVDASLTESHGEDAVAELRGWWEQTAHDEVAGLTAKMVEYGGLHRATDLEEIGRGLVNSGVRMIGRNGPEGYAGSDAAYQELGCYFYLLGKFARWTAAVAEGRTVSDDTLLDIGIYVRMVQRIRAVGGWPV